jgi:hypothetical protein
VSLAHILHKERQVYLGGWPLWPGSRRRWGGRWYTVPPLSTLRFVQLVDAIGGASEDFLAHPLVCLASLTPILVREPVRAKDLRRLCPLQIEELWQALIATTDLAYLFEKYLNKGEPESEPDEKCWDIVDLLDFVCEQRPAHTFETLKAMPAAQFMAILDAIKKKIDARNEAAEKANRGENDWREMTEDDWGRLQEKYRDG